jgi:lipopolysaccharide export system permease protein
VTKRFSRYLISEILPLYGAGLVALLLLLLSYFFLGQLAAILARGVPLTLVAQFLLYKLPVAAGRGIPLALLFAALLTFTRLAQDGEIKAALLLGLSPKQFAVPMLGLGLLISLLSFTINEAVIPWSEQRANEVQKDILIQSPDTFLEEGSFFSDALGRSIYIEALEPGGNFRNVTVIQSSGAQGPREIIQAERGVLSEAEGVWNLSGLRFRTFRNSRLVLDASAETGILPVRELAAGTNVVTELTYLPMRELLARLRDRSSGPLPAEWTALHRKFAEPLAAAAFALFALAIGLVSFRRNFGLGLVSVLFLTFVYYATWSVANTLGAQGTIPAWTAGWLPVALYFFAALILLAVSWRR